MSLIARLPYRLVRGTSGKRFERRRQAISRTPGAFRHEMHEQLAIALPTATAASWTSVSVAFSSRWRTSALPGETPGRPSAGRECSAWCRSRRADRRSCWSGTRHRASCDQAPAAPSWAGPFCLEAVSYSDSQFGGRQMLVRPGNRKTCGPAPAANCIESCSAAARFARPAGGLFPWGRGPALRSRPAACRPSGSSSV